jgi:uncharacterized YkwD family protein
MKKRIRILLAAVLAAFSLAMSAGAAGPYCRTVSAGTLQRLFALWQKNAQQVAVSAPADTSCCPDTQTAAQEQPVVSQGADDSVSAYEAEVVRLVNAVRKQNGLAALTISADLGRIARLKSQDMHDKGYFSHTSPTYGTPFAMLKSFGIAYRTAGENIAMGYATPQAVVDAWMNSAGHRANILNAAYTQLGVGYVSDGNYWTQEFIG